jgi:hypothetical protein
MATCIPPVQFASRAKLEFLISPSFSAENGWHLKS